MTKLKQMRLIMKLTQKKMAERIGVKPPTVNSLERKGIYDTSVASLK